MFERLEPCAGKLARTVLRGGSGGNAASLLGGHWQHLRTTNIIESPFSNVRLRTAASKRYKRVAGATAMIWKLLLVAEQTFRKLNSLPVQAPLRLAQVMAGLRYEDGELIAQPPKERATEPRLAA